MKCGNWWCRLAGVLLLAAGWLIAGPNIGHVQANEKEEAAKQVKRRAEASAALDTLASMLTTRGEQLKVIEDLKAELRRAKEDATKKEIEKKITAAQGKAAQLDRQISALTTGVSEEEMRGDEDEKFNLQSELESLVQPFVKMMKDATENARQIESLKRTIELARERQQIADRAVERLRLLEDVGKAGNGQKTPAIKHVGVVIKDWKKRAEEAANLEDTARQQMQVRLDQQSTSADGLGTYATQFFRSRGLNLLLAISAFGAVLLIMDLIARVAGYVQRRQGIPRSFATRLVSLIYRLATMIVAFLALLAVFNIMNDWLLLGIASLFALAAAWIGLKLLPNIVEQVTLLLNLGAVQERERVMMAGVPWRVDRLDFYTDLVNPALDGGSFTVPVRELVGLHSRPSAEDEAWFPTSKGDWVQLDNGHVGQVVTQTPELVQVKELGGSLVTYETSGFLAMAPRNLSTGFRMKVEFGLDYRHQKDATDTIPDKLQAHVMKGLVTEFGEEAIAHIDVDLLRAADSAIVYEVEADFPGDMAPRYEDIEREMARLLVDACNVHDWTIPFPQMVMHRAR